MVKACLLKLLPRLKSGKFKVEELKNVLEIDLKNIKDFASLLCKIDAAETFNDYIAIKDDAKPKLAIYLISNNFDPNMIIRKIGWRDFELMVANILKEYEYKVYHSVRIKKPKIEIDILAVKNDYALALDCKQWKVRDISGSSAQKIVEKQIQRVKVLLSSNLPREYGFRKVLPVILALYAPRPELLNGIPIVPFMNLKGLLLELDGYADLLNWFEAK